ncbi:MAG: hypothetical protein ABL958_14545, partial [Bdellovibrionia bacterium]
MKIGLWVAFIMLLTACTKAGESGGEAPLDSTGVPQPIRLSTYSYDSIKLVKYNADDRNVFVLGWQAQTNPPQEIEFYNHFLNLELNGTLSVKFDYEKFRLTGSNYASVNGTSATCTPSMTLPAGEVAAIKAALDGLSICRRLTGDRQISLEPIDGEDSVDFFIGNPHYLEASLDLDPLFRTDVTGRQLDGY